MSKLNKLMISGIRSFSPAHKNVVEFSTPLTLIVGPNGTGKTTIIECLKYATTGNFPPNSKGGAFVFDPNLANEIDVKGEIKLKFISCSNEEIVCTRSLQVSQKNKKLIQKTLETTLSKEINGKSFLISSKLAEIDKELGEYLGSTNSLLENVIFCHQEESTWPLSEPRILKEKLDEIFNSTKYNKALKSLKDTKKIINTDCKLKEQELSFLYKEKTKKDQILNNISNIQEEIDKKNLVIKGYSEKLIKVEELIKNINEEIKVYEKIEQNYKMVKLELDSCINFVKNFGFKILDENEKDESDSEECSIQDTNDSFGRLRLNARKERYEARHKELNIEKMDYEFYRIEQVKESIADHSNKLQSIKDSINNLQTEKSKFINEKQQIVEFLKQEFSCEENKIIEKSDAVFKNVELDIQKKRDELARETEQLILQRNKQKEAEEIIKQNLKFIEEHKHLKPSEIDVDELINIDYEKRLDMEAEINELMEEYSEKHEILNTAYNSLSESLKKSQTESRIKEIKSIIDKIDFNKLEDLLSTKKRSLEIEKSKLKNIQNECLHQRIAIDQKREKQISIDKEIEFLLGKLNIKGINNCNPKYLEAETIKSTEDFYKEIEETNNTISAISNASAIYKNFLRISEQRCECPLCKKKLSDSEKVLFSERLESVIFKIPETVKNAEKKKEDLENTIKTIKNENIEISKRNVIKHKILELIEERKSIFEHIKDRVSTIGNKDLQINDENILNVANEFKNYLSESEKSKEKIIEEISLEIKNLEQQKSDYLKYTSELKRLESDIKKYSNTSINIEDIKREISELKSKIDLKKSDFNIFNNLIKSLEIKQQKIKDELNVRELIAKREKLAQECSNTKNIDFTSMEESLNKKVEKLDKISNNFMKKKIEAEMKIKRYKELNVAINENECKFIEEQAKYDKCTDYKIPDDLFFCGERIKSNDIFNEYERVRKILAERKNTFIELNKKIEKIKSKMAVIAENIKLKIAKQKIIKIQEEFKDFDFNKLRDLRLKLSELEDKRMKIRTSESLIAGELKQLNFNITQLKNDLVNNYKDTNTQYIKCSIELKALEMSICDLDKCINALDKSIVDFHSSKLDELNGTLRDLWTNTYKGNDIDYIELKSETSETKAYNYAIMMVKNGVSLEMRGRCSAGQKMIASILIRLALADSFSSDCCILALDEPTTNLDRENIESLALTLSQLIKERSNAQLIIITHDEEFVQLINREGIEYFYRLRRDSTGIAHIERHSIY